ncbi:MAG: hypothetical protein A2W61_07910 [Deltaproteobacteria bacterium RIFCSPLOWO2_01_44_7]|nr:MAG: hypothetical protein A2712_10290 [Deltaproteobacteria bacterium RIFCSPHIGHO2_01_FULL_43_49]OGQ15498.1 MAG: hypothetical protein A3D22_10820 [Deltaproteobacteria bacterium RIFCSPHIGHO2_02_FULL_44_53]OGQ29691.1 MAG: hypothetical protein A3D98_11020 [Deltaproteobacteria bacterium RIFCSPHIGHO2_12_FULL_44_21]OGQ32304.1 MAG: hypothetical protein A2979_00665 [Deltaproteobacteria bacterium RIFCSPLOWO2_01_FULL_45_74]OGQ37667.1 MAG: hypothetical protein A2W61_07910 [Deltaproteobacteria bacterium 
MRLLLKRFAVCVVFLAFIGASSGLATETQVYFNVSNHKVHKLTCPWGERCTKNCIIIPRAEAYKRGGVPCKVCGG